MLLRTPHQPACSADDMVRLWLTSKSAGGWNTNRTYSDQIKWFREWLHERNLDLDSFDTFRLVEEIQTWAMRDSPSRSTYNHCLSILSSFYQYARQHQLLPYENPVDFLDRLPVAQYSMVKLLDFTEVQRRLAAIDRSTLKGKRDFAFLVIALTTGRRRAELVQLRMGDIEFSGEQIALIWRHCKGGKVMRDILSDFAKRALFEYLHTLYGKNLMLVKPDSAVWASVAPYNKGQPLQSTSVFRICLQNLGITAVHRLRHTFAHAMEEVGAKVSDIQAKLGHNSLATTSIYLSALRRPHNPYGDSIATLFGIQDILDSPAQHHTEKKCEVCGEALDVFAQSDYRRR
jgi:integrase/recombinase XerC